MGVNPMWFHECDKGTKLKGITTSNVLKASSLFVVLNAKD